MKEASRFNMINRMVPEDMLLGKAEGIKYHRECPIGNEGHEGSIPTGDRDEFCIAITYRGHDYDKDFKNKRC